MKINFKPKKIKPVAPMVLMTLLLSGFAAGAQIALPSAEQAVKVALNNNLEIRARDLEVAGNRALIKSAGEMPKLDVNAQLGQYNSVNFDQALQLSQTIPFPSLFGAKKALFQSQTQAKEIQKQSTQLELTQQVRSFYYQIKYLQNNRKQLRQLDSLFADFIRVAELRYKTGDTKKLDISSAQARKGEIGLLVQQNEVYLKNAYQSLQALLNTGEVQVPDDENYQPLNINTVLDTALIGNHPSVKALYQNALIAEQSKKVERAQALPDFSLGYTNQSLTGSQTVNGQEQFFGSGRRFSFVNVGITIPLTYGATRARVKSIDLQKQAALAEAKQQTLQLAAQYQNALEQYRQEVAQFNYYQNTALRNADEIIAAAQLGYRTGDIGYVEHLYALQTATDIRLNYLKSIQQLNQSAINIYSLINQ